jgi:LacI family transcriptional regulator
MVAERAGTSISTVSLVVNGKSAGRISAAIVDRVQTAVDELGYVDLVVLVAPDLTNPFFGQVIRGVRDELAPRYQLLLSVTDRGAQPSAADVRRFGALRPAGLLVDAPSATFLDDLEDDAPLVLLDAPGLESRAAAVNYDVRPGVDALVAHLHERGHRRIAYLDGTTRAATFALRRSLLHDAAARTGIEVVASAASDVDLDAARSVTRAELPAWGELGVTAVVAAADTIAYGVLAEAARAGLRVPEELAVAGFDDLPSSAVTAPALTSVALPGAALGRAAARRLRSIVEGSDEAAPEVLAAHLVPRASTA